MDPMAWQSRIAHSTEITATLSSLPTCRCFVSTSFKHLKVYNSKHRSDKPSCAHPPHHVRHDPLEQCRRQNSAETQRSLSCAVWYQGGILDTGRTHGIAVPVGTTLKSKETKHCVFNVRQVEACQGLIRQSHQSGEYGWGPGYQPIEGYPNNHLVYLRGVGVQITKTTRWWGANSPPRLFFFFLLLFGLVIGYNGSLLQS